MAADRKLFFARTEKTAPGEVMRTAAMGAGRTDGVVWDYGRGGFLSIVASWFISPVLAGTRCCESGINGREEAGGAVLLEGGEGAGRGGEQTH